jgi:hypothetical protein
LRFEILDRLTSPYEIFVRELVASDGIDASEILLVDAIGKNSKVVSLNMYVARFVANIFFIAKAGFLKKTVEIYFLCFT